MIYIDFYIFLQVEVNIDLSLLFRVLKSINFYLKTLPLYMNILKILHAHE